MVAGGNEHGHGHGLQTADKLLPGLKVGAGAVQQVAAEQHEIDMLPLRKLRHAGKQTALLHPADGGLAVTQPLKRRIQMQIRGVQDPDSTHFSLTACAPVHLPVSGSISNMQPSIMHGPLADS